MSRRSFPISLVNEEMLNIWTKISLLQKSSIASSDIAIGLFKGDNTILASNQDSESIEYGQSISDKNIDPIGDKDYYTFNGSDGDLITLQLSDSSIILGAQFRLYNPDGSLAMEVLPENRGIGNALLQDFELDQDGTYSIMVSDQGGDNTGDYNFTLESINNPGDSVAISYGDSLASTLEVTSDLDHYTFNGSDGDLITLQLSDSSIILGAQFRLYNPDGSLAMEVLPENRGIGNALLQDFELDQDGTYSIMVSDQGGDNTGNYNFTLESINNPGDSVAISYGDSLASTLEVTSDLDHYTFNGSDGDLITLQLSDSSIILGAQFRLYNPDGSLAMEVLPENRGIGNALLQDFELDQDGTYSIMVSDQGGDNTGNYNFTLDGIPASPVDCVPTITGTDNDDLLEGTFDDDNISGLGGNDLISGHWGDDCLSGGDGDDRLMGNWGNDYLIGDAGDDQLTGSWGDDLLDSGLGNDELSGGPGHDRFVLQTGNGLDIILDYQDGEDQFVLKEGLTFGQLTIAQQTNQALISVTATNEQLALLNQTTVSQIGSSDFVVM